MFVDDVEKIYIELLYKYKELHYSKVGSSWYVYVLLAESVDN